MLAKNIKEYEIIREAMESNRHRLTTHLSFAIGGSGILYIAMTALMNPDSNSLSLALICMFSATIISSFFYLALYKFNSINRYAGYCKLINLEIGASKIDKNRKKSIEDVITWEVCAGKLENAKEHLSFPKEHWKDVLKYKGLNIDNICKNFKKYNLLKPEADKWGVLKGVGLLFSVFFKKYKSKSWEYPLYSSYVYYILILFFFVLSCANLYTYLKIKSWVGVLRIELFQIALIGVLALVIFMVIVKSLAELYKLMLGSKTVSAYCWKFLPFRIRILNKFNIKPHYYNTEKENKC
ncbi:hypothetical protein [Flavivirga algicola]|uniref:Uncharacterized protein n=1 Tax=Flavivirga algicola TaxID=2729136 RepID=A0ABX1S2L9_9FLAO|nr:hypothetical protein [Flavivirga algicola]NMH88795.1 hypothetical protein [Flavivirga algicola]